MWQKNDPWRRGQRVHVRPLGVNGTLGYRQGGALGEMYQFGDGSRGPVAKVWAVLIDDTWEVRFFVREVLEPIPGDPPTLPT